MANFPEYFPHDLLIERQSIVLLPLVSQVLISATVLAPPPPGPPARGLLLSLFLRRLVEHLAQNELVVYAVVSSSSDKETSGVH